LTRNPNCSLSMLPSRLHLSLRASCSCRALSTLPSQQPFYGWSPPAASPGFNVSLCSSKNVNGSVQDSSSSISSSSKSLEPGWQPPKQQPEKESASSTSYAQTDALAAVASPSLFVGSSLGFILTSALLCVKEQRCRHVQLSIEYLRSCY